MLAEQNALRHGGGKLLLKWLTKERSLGKPF